MSAEELSMMDSNDVTLPDGALRAKVLRLIQVKAALDANKSLYEELDRLTIYIHGLVGTGTLNVALKDDETIFMHNGVVNILAPLQVVSIVDNFSDKNTVFRVAGVKRFEATLETMDEYAAKLDKAAKKKSKAVQS